MKRLAVFLSPYSIRSQLLIWLLGPLLLIGIISIYDSWHSARSTADTVSDRVLAGSALAISERVFVNDDNQLEVDIPYVALQMLTSSEDDRVFYKIETANGEFVTGYRGLLLPEFDPAQLEVSFKDGIFRSDPVRVAIHYGAASSNTRSFGFRVAVAETTNARSAVARSILLRSLARQAALLAGAAILVWFAVAFAFRPLRRLERAVERRSPEDVRPIEHQVPKEVQGLVLTINELVSRFAASIKALENFTSNASHQFRTPLALIKTHLEVASRETTKAGQKKAIKQAHTAVGEAERLMSQLLVLSRLDAASTSLMQSRTCSLSDVGREVCEEIVLQLSHRDKLNVDLGFHCTENIEIRADKTLAQEVVRNLVDNAIKHSGPTPKVDVYVTQNKEMGFVSVRDHGKGFDPKLLLQQSPASIKPGSQNNEGRSVVGLGLSIIHEIIALLEGALTADQHERPEGMTVTAGFKLVSNKDQ